MHGALARTANSTPRLLAEFGVEIGPGGIVVLSDMPKAETCHIHHSRMPVALVAFAQVSEVFALGRFPKTRLVDLVSKRPSMDGREAIALGAVCGVDVSAVMWPRSPAPAFCAQLQRVIYRYGIEDLFVRNPSRAINGIEWRPRGIGPRTDAVIATEMQAWRRAFRAKPAHRQMMAATILWLYRGGPDKIWMKGMSANTWSAANAIGTLRANGLLSDWGKLVALYPGW